MTARRLRLLRINDRANRFWEKDLDDEPGWFEPFVVTSRDVTVRRITGTESSQLFWQLLGPGAPPPDLILVDINFESDKLAPLKDAFAQIPTGLLHGIPLLAWSRTSGALSVLVFHTGDPDAFRSKAPLPMRLLAAELGAVARALAGEGGEEPVTRANIEPAFNWIASHSFSNEKFALLAAIRLYRERLYQAAQGAPGPQGVVVAPLEHLALLARVTAAAERSGPVEPDAEGWPGVSLIRPDGSRDSISVQSLFGEIPKLTAEMFLEQRAKADQPWDATGEVPPVGDYVRGLARWTNVFRAASRVAALLPVGGEAPADGMNVNQLVSRRTHGSETGLVRLLVLLFQVVRQYRRAADDWRQIYLEFDWSPHRAPKETAVRHRAPDRTLAATVEIMHGRILKLAGDADAHERLARFRTGAPEAGPPANSFHEDELAETLVARGQPRMPAAALRFHLDIIASLRLIAPNSAERGSWLVTRPGLPFPRDVLPPIPDPFVPGWLRPSGKEIGLRGGLQLTLGFGKEFHPVRRILAESGAIGRADPSEFLRRLLDEGRCPGWLRELCRDYAREELCWAEERLWPPFLRGGVT